jgi:hypothetical protein
LTTSGSSSESQHHLPQQINSTHFSRKRTLSSVSEPSVDRVNKALKSHHSPVPNVRNKLHVHDPSRKLSTFNAHVFAATILYAAFRYVDHWPEQFAQAYSEDSFGPRLWVDDARCSNFVNDLCRSFDNEPHVDDAETLAIAELALEFYKRDDDQETESLGSLSDSRDSRRRSRNLMEAPFPKPNLKAQLSTSADSLLASSSHDLDSSKPRDDDKTQDSSINLESVNDAPSVDTNCLPVIVTSRDAFLDELQLQRLTFIGRKRRYFGVNLIAAENSIISSLKDRLEQKSKQNSGLLQALPSFTSIPKVRLIISQNLEQWLKSPALAGLARSLFTLIVANMKNVDPPLEDDLKAIYFILDMKLKSNQVSTNYFLIGFVALSSFF